jgi:endonuclease/exonuclease/phosphatase family metal-dependent hydrolase
MIIACSALAFAVVGAFVGLRYQPAQSANSAPSRDGSIVVMSFNIRYDTPNDGEHAWPHRRDRAASMIRFHQADLVGLQEALRGQIDDLVERLPEYAWFGVGRDDGVDAGEFSAIMVRRDRFEVLDEATFWLSETPEVPGSKSWDAAITRVVTWGRLHDRSTGDTLVHLNTHFDHIGVTAREESARLLTVRIPEIAGNHPAIVTGDFNTQPDTEAYRILSASLQDARDLSATPHHGPDGTFFGFTVSPDEPGPRIDYIFVRGPFDVLRHASLPDHWHGRYPSDHVPVLAEVVLR